MANYRIFVEKRKGFQVEADSLREELNTNLGLHIRSLRLLNVYDLFGFTDALLDACRYSVFGEKVTDRVLVGTEQTNMFEVLGVSAQTPYLATEFIPGQFDQRAASAVDCVHLIQPEAEITIRSGRVILMDETIGEKEREKIRHYCINKVESREKDMQVLGSDVEAEIKPLQSLSGFTQMGEDQYTAFCQQWGLAMNEDDLREVVAYFRKEGRQPTETELKILDTYWSDHCRHTTFMTCLEDIKVEDSFIKEDIENTLELAQHIRVELGREHKSLCLMELATIGARYLKKKGILHDMEQSEENNACSIYTDVVLTDEKGEQRTEQWLLQFKNETHNHPTEIEPFGGASTCLGGAIRDPLSGRAYVYQAMRVTGAGDIYQSIGDTLPGKLPQQLITKKAAAGYSSYGNQIGLAATHIREIYHPSYVAKRMEVGAVVAAVKAENVRRERPEAGDVILLMGGRTGRDGIGGATGSSKQHTEKSLDVCGSEVQKGNAPEERKLQRLFRRPEVTRLIKKSNDFGAGGVSVAIGELADGLDIYLDRVPTKYAGLNATELAISESQERMAVVVEAKDRARMEAYCQRDNVEVTYVADVTNTGRMRLYYKGETIVDLSREFIDSAGAKHYAQATIGKVTDTMPSLLGAEVEGNTLQEKWCKVLSQPNVTSQKGMIEQFDATIGRSTVLMPFGGKTQMTETQVSVQKLPADGFTNTASMMAFGYNPFLSEWSPYHGAAYAVVEAAAKVVAAGGDWSGMRYSYQEYFERMTKDPHTWGKPMAALLGALKMQVALGLPSIGGKDSMSGTFEHINVPPTLIAFGITTVDANRVISPEFKKAGNRLYLVRHTPLKNGMPDTEQLKKNWNYIYAAITRGQICSAYALGFGGVAEAITKCCMGNRMGVNIHYTEQQEMYGSILVETTEALEGEQLIYMGEVTNGVVMVNGEEMSLDVLQRACTEPFARIYPDRCTNLSSEVGGWAAQTTQALMTYPGEKVEHPRVYIPVFPGTNCDYDSAKAWRQAGAEVEIGIFRNLTAQDVLDSISAMQQAIERCHILMFVGGFSAGDEPDGSGKFIANVIQQPQVSAAMTALIERGGLILGICNGFQALVKSGWLPYGKTGMLTEASPTLFRNDIHRHVSQMVTTRVESIASPWLQGFHKGDFHTIAVSHGEGKFVVNAALARQLFERGQVAFRYAHPMTGEVTMDSPYNPNGADYAIEGIVSENGQILGKMAHSERFEENVFKNIDGNKHQDLFGNAVRYFRHEK